jgi:hypothetical protein
MVQVQRSSSTAAIATMVAFFATLSSIRFATVRYVSFTFLYVYIIVAQLSLCFGMKMASSLTTDAFAHKLFFTSHPSLSLPQ